MQPTRQITSRIPLTKTISQQCRTTPQLRQTITTNNKEGQTPSLRWKNHNSCERKGHINRFSECCALKKCRTLIHQRVYSLDAHYQTLTFLYFCFLFVSKCTPRNQLNQAETQNSNERQIAVGASKPNLVDVFVLKKSQTLWGYIGSSSDKSSAILYWIKRSANDRNSSVRERSKENNNNGWHAHSSWGTVGRPNPH